MAAAPVLRQPLGSILSVTTANAIANNAYSVAADKLTIDNGSAAGLLADFELDLSFAAAPVAGVVQLFAMDHSLDGATAPNPAAPSATVQGRFVGSFSPSPLASNSVASSWVMRLNSVSLTRKTDFYILNNGTAQSINSGAVLKAQVWSPGTA